MARPNHEIKATYSQQALSKDVDHEERYKNIATGGRTKLALQKRSYREAKGPDGTRGFTLGRGRPMNDVAHMFGGLEDNLGDGWNLNDGGPLESTEADAARRRPDNLPIEAGQFESNEKMDGCDGDDSDNEKILMIKPASPPPLRGREAHRPQEKPQA